MKLKTMKPKIPTNLEARKPGNNIRHSALGIRHFPPLPGFLASIFLLAFLAAPLPAQSVTAINRITGAFNEGNDHVTATTTAGTLVAANRKRRSVLIRNIDATITVYIGKATVTSSNGMPLKAGESVVVDTTALLQVISASGSPVVAYVEVYD